MADLMSASMFGHHTNICTRVFMRETPGDHHEVPWGQICSLVHGGTTTPPPRKMQPSCSDSSTHRTQYGFTAVIWPTLIEVSPDSCQRGSLLVHTLICKDDTGEFWRCNQFSWKWSLLWHLLKALALLCCAVEWKERTYSYAANVRAQNCIWPDAWGGIAWL